MRIFGRVSGVGAGLVVFSSALTGCGSCGGPDAEVVELTETPEAGEDSGTNASSNEGTSLNGPMEVGRNLPRVGWMLMVELAGAESARLWVEGQRASEQHPIDRVRFSPSGFSWDVGEGIVRVLGPGGGQYYRFGETIHPEQPLRSFGEDAEREPEDYEVDWSVGRSGRWMLSLRHTDGTVVPRMGALIDEPIGVHWRLGELPAGVASTELIRADPTVEYDQGPHQVHWPEQDGVLLPQLPEDCEEIQGSVTADQEEVWTTDIGLIRSGDVSIRQAIVADLDRDGDDEGVVCVTGGSGETARLGNYNCFVVDNVQTERRYYGLYLGANGDNPLQAFSRGEGNYLAWVGRRNLSTDSSEPDLLHLVRFDGSDYISVVQR